jgi:peptide/nickel transport system substrate-binding protein
MWSAVQQPAYSYDLTKAKQLLTESGVDPSKVTLSFGSLGGPSSIQAKVGLLFQSDMAKLGIKVTITDNAWADILKQTSKPDTTKSAYAIQIAPAYPDPDSILVQGWALSSHGSWSGAQWYTNKTVDQQIATARSTLDENSREQLYQQIQNQIISDSPSIFMMNLATKVALNSNVGGYKFIVEYYNYRVYDYFAKS